MLLYENIVLLVICLISYFHVSSYKPLKSNSIKGFRHCWQNKIRCASI